MNKLTISFLLIFLLSLPLLFAEKLNDTTKHKAQKQLESFLLNKKLTAKVTFPASASGIDLNLHGEWDHKSASRSIKNSGVGIDVNEAATVTEVKIKEKHIEIQLNGGGFGTTWDLLNESEYQRQQRSASGKASGGSRINLRFNRPITMEDIENLDQFTSYLEPLLDTSVLKQDVLKKEIPEEFKDAASKGQIVPGMDKPTVFAIIGEPKNKNVDISGDIPIEKWQYDLPDLKTRIILFKEGKVTEVKEF